MKTPDTASIFASEVEAVDFVSLTRAAFADVFAIQRAIVAKGNIKTIEKLETIFEVGGFEKTEYPTGTKLGTWVVPQEWNLVSYQLTTPDGIVLQDLSDTNLRVVYGSESFAGVVDSLSLSDKIFTHDILEEAVPFVTNYYGNFDWGICMTQLEKAEILKNYPSLNVNIETEVKDGDLTLWSRTFGSGKKQKSPQNKILFWSYICHPQMAQNELSGPFVMFFLMQILNNIEKKGFRFFNQYEFSISSETIGAIAKIQTTDISNFYKACHVLTCLGIPADELTVQEAIDSDSYATRVIKKAVKDNSSGKYKTNSFLSRGSDERQFMWPSVNLDCAYFCTKKYHQYPEYHTNLDDHLDDETLKKSVTIYLDAILIHETNTIALTTTNGEPMLSQFGSWPELNKGGRLPESYRATDFLILCNGKRDLLEISEILDWPYKIVLLHHEKYLGLGLLEDRNGR